MRAETALRKRDRAIVALRDLINVARLSSMPHDKLLQGIGEIREKTLKGVSSSVMAFFNGYARAMLDTLDAETVYGGMLNGKFVSVDSRRADYYQKQGISPVEYSQLSHNGSVKDQGAYWASSLKPFYIGPSLNG